MTNDLTGLDLIWSSLYLPSRCLTDGHHAKKDPWHNERGFKQAGTLKMGESLNGYHLDHQKGATFICQMY